MGHADMIYDCLVIKQPSGILLQLKSKCYLEASEIKFW